MNINITFATELIDKATDLLKSNKVLDLGNILLQFNDQESMAIKPNVWLGAVILPLLIHFLYKKTKINNLNSIINCYKFHPRKKSFSLDIQWYLYNITGINYVFEVLASILLFKTVIIECLGSIEKYSDLSLFYNLRNSIVNFPRSIVVIIFFIFVVLTTEFFNYWYHRFMHSNSILWNFHKVHHQPNQLSILASFRFHPIDSVIATFANQLSLTISLILWAPIFVKSDYQNLERLISNEFFLVYLLYSSIIFFHQFNHSNIYISYGIYFDKIFYSPSLHTIHHSKEIIGKNYGGLLSVWDYIFGTLYIPKNYQEFEKISQNLGTSDATDEEYSNIFKAILQPFFDCFKKFREFFY